MEAKKVGQTSNGGDDSNRRGKRKRLIAMGKGDEDDSACLPLSEVVSDCKDQWFQDSLKEAKAGDVNMQVLVGQMYYRGYDIPKDVDKVTIRVILILRNQLMILDPFLQIEGEGESRTRSIRHFDFFSVG